MKVRELIEELKKKDPEALVIVHMNGDLGPQIVGFISEDLMYVENEQVRYPADAKKEANTGTVGISSNQ